MLKQVPSATRVAVAALFLLVPVHAAAKSLIGTAASHEEVVTRARQLLTEQGALILGQPRTLQAKSMRELASRTAPIAKDAFQRYGGDAARYLMASNMRNQRAGKTLEAVIAWRVNAQRARLGIPDQMLVTAAEGFPGHAADLIDRAPDGSVLAKYQVKWGSNNAVKALQNPKYHDMTILTTRESWETIAHKLSAEEAKAARRGISLLPKWQAVREAMDSKRLPSIVGGKSLPRAAAVQRFAESFVQRFFREKAVRYAPRTAARVGQLAATFAGSGRILGKVVVIADIAGTGYAEFQDVQRFRAGEIGGGYLAFKSSLRIYQLQFAYYALTAPEPTTKVVAAIVAGVLVVVDVASDPVYGVIFERRQSAARALFESIDREEQFHAARANLLHEIELLGSDGGGR